MHYELAVPKKEKKNSGILVLDEIRAKEKIFESMYKVLSF